MSLTFGMRHTMKQANDRVNTNKLLSKSGPNQPSFAHAELEQVFSQDSIRICLKDCSHIEERQREPTDKWRKQAKPKKVFSFGDMGQNCEFEDIKTDSCNFGRFELLKRLERKLDRSRL
jgi:hypothetical protein